MRVLTWLTAMWVLLCPAAVVTFSWWDHGAHDPRYPLLAWAIQYVLAVCVLGLYLAAPGLCVAWLGYGVWRLTATRASGLRRPAATPPLTLAPPRAAARDAGHRWLDC